MGKKITFGALVLAVVLFAGISDTLPRHQAKAIAKECAADTLAQKIGCYHDQLKVTARESGEKRAFTVLAKLQKADHDAAVDCHFIAHGIGYGIYEADPGNWQERFWTVNPTCTNGAMHGIFEMRMYDTPERLTQDSIQTICAGSPKKDCGHILGHFALLETRSIEPAVELCSALSNPVDRGWCYTGLFMENIFPLASHFDKTEEAKKQLEKRIPSLQELCLSFGGNTEVELACWWTLPYAFVRIEDDPEKLFGLCNSAPSRETRLNCKRYGVVMKATELSTTPQEATSLLCTSSFGEEKQYGSHTLTNHCYYYVSMVTIRRFPETAPAVITFCNGLQNPEQEYCFRGVAYAFDLSFTEEETMRLCREATPAMQEICTLGVGN